MAGKFRVSKTWTIGGLIVQPVLFLFFLFLVLGSFFSDVPMTVTSWVLIFIYVALAASSLYSIVDIITGYYLLTESSVAHKNFFRTKTLHFSEVAGYVRSAYAFELLPNVPGKRKIRISTYIKDYEKLAAWAEKNFNNLRERK
jgi:hypothetical protein